MNRSFSYKIHIILFLLPALILFLGILIAPIVMSASYSMYEWKLGNPEMKYVGLDNYVTLFSRQLVNDLGKTFDNDKCIVDALKNSFLLAGLSVFVQLPLALLIALRLGKGIRGERAYLSIFFMPVLISTVIIGQLWAKIYDPGSGGILNAGLKALGIDQWLFPMISKSTPMPFTGAWTGTKSTALIACFIPILWQYVGYHMLLMYAGIKGVPSELKEAAMLDGCSEGQVNRYIIIPYIKPILKVSVIFAVTGSLKSFDLIYVLLKDTTKAEVPSTLMYKLLFKHNLYGMGSAIAVILIILCFFFALLISLAFKDKGGKVT